MGTSVSPWWMTARVPTAAQAKAAAAREQASKRTLLNKKETRQVSRQQGRRASEQAGLGAWSNHPTGPSDGGTDQDARFLQELMNDRQGLIFVHFSAQPELFQTRITP